MPNQIDTQLQNIQTTDSHSRLIWTISAVIVLASIGGGLFLGIHKNVTDQEPKTALTAQCKDFSIALKTRTHYNFVEGNFNAFGFYIERSGTEESLITTILPNIARFRPLSVNTSIPTRVFELPDINTSDAWEFSEPPLMNIFLNSSAGQTYSQQDFNDVADCLEANRDSINSALATLGSSFPPEDSRLYYAERIGGIAYRDIDSLLLEHPSLSIVDEFLYNGDSLSVVEIKESGEIYDKEFGGYIGDIFAGSPVLAQYPIHYSLAKNKDGEDIISYVAKLQRQLGIKAGQITLKAVAPGKDFQIFKPNSNNGVATFYPGQKIQVEVSSNAPGGTIKVYLRNDAKGVAVLIANTPNIPNESGVVNFTSSALPALAPGTDYYVEATLFDTHGTAIRTVDNKNYGYITIVSQKLPPPRVLSFTGPQELRVGEEGAWHISAASGIGSELDCIIFWDAKHTAQTSILDSYATSSGCISGVEEVFTNKYSAPGAYSIAAKATQGDEQYGTSFLSITVTP